MSGQHEPTTALDGAAEQRGASPRPAPQRPASEPQDPASGAAGSGAAGSRDSRDAAFGEAASTDAASSRAASRAAERLQSRYPDLLAGMVPLLRSLIRYLRRPVHLTMRLWRRSIQLRVVATTLLLSLGVVLLLGVVVIGQVRNGLLDAKLQSARSQALGGFVVAQEKADISQDPRAQTGAPSGGATPESGTWLNDLVEQLGSSGQGLYAVVALSSDVEEQPFAEGSAGTRSPRATGNIVPEESVPRELRAVLDNEGGVHETYTQIVRDDSSSRESALVIGKRLNDVNNRPYQLYYLFPFSQEEDTLSLVKGTLATAGVFVVVLLGAIAWLVVRQVVTPVRMAARIAERLAAGRLQERMRVSGEDDIARLGESFNKMAQNLQVKIQQLEDLSRMQRRFVSDVSHELRTPLTTVRMAADVLYEERAEFDPATARSAELLQNQLDRFESLLTDLLEISRFDAGAAALDAEPVDLRDVVHRVVEAAEPLAERKGGSLTVRGDERPVVAEADARRVERVLRNLVVNAVEHGEGRDVIVRLAASADGAAVAVTVRDYGVGLKPGEAARVFNRFWRADPARARTTGGTGLGLSIALEDARLHGGWLQAWGEPGGGSQFRLTLPATVGGALHGSPLPLEPEDSRRNRGLNASGLPFRRPGGPAGASAVTEARHGRLPVPPRPVHAPSSAVPAVAPGDRPDQGDGTAVTDDPDAANAANVADVADVADAADADAGDGPDGPDGSATRRDAPGALPLAPLGEPPPSRQAGGLAGTEGDEHHAR